MKKDVLNNIDEIELALKNDFRVIDSIGDKPWCWINSKGKFIPCLFQGHDLQIMELFTDEYNPEMADYVLSKDLILYGSTHYIEQHWVRISEEFISLPIKFTARQKLAIEQVVSKFPDTFFSKDKMPKQDL